MNIVWVDVTTYQLFKQTAVINVQIVVMNLILHIIIKVFVKLPMETVVLIDIIIMVLNSVIQYVNIKRL